MTQIKEKVLDGELLDAVTITSMIPAKFNAVASGLEDIKERYTGLKIAGTGDTKGYEVVRLAIADVREKRVAVEKFRKIFKQPLLEIGKAIDTEAGRITSMLESIEEPLKLEKSAVDDEKARIKAEKEAAERAAIEEEQRKIAEAIKAEADAKAAEQAEKIRLIEEENARLRAEQAEKDRLAKAEADAAKKLADEEIARQQAEIKKIKAEQEAQALKIAQQERAIAEAEKAEAERLAQVERERIEKIRIEEQAKIAAEKAEAERLAQVAFKKELAPDYEVLMAYATALDLIKIVDFGNIKHPFAVGFASSVEGELSSIIKKIKEFTEV